MLTKNIIIKVYFFDYVKTHRETITGESKEEINWKEEELRAKYYDYYVNQIINELEVDSYPE